MPERATITQRSDGRFVATIQLHSKRRFLYGRSETEVRRKLTELQRQSVVIGAVPTPGRRTVNELLDSWLDASRPTLKPRTLLTYQETAHRYFRPTLGQVKLARLEPTQIQALYNRLAATGRPRIAAQAHSSLHRACRLGVLWGWLGQNPCDRLLPPKYRAPRKEVWSSEETAHFLARTAEDRHGPLWAFLIYTGARIGEATALTWADVQGNLVTIRRSAHRIGGEWVLTEPKTQSGSRTLAIPGALVPALRSEKARQAAR